MSLTKIPEQTRQLVIDRNRDKAGNIRCAHCHRKVAKGGYDIDHIKPEHDSTPDARVDPDNLQVLCSRPKSNPAGWGCHQKKSAAEAREWARRNRPRRNWVAALAPGWVGLTMMSWAWFALGGQERLGNAIVLLSVALVVLLMFIVLVQNHFRSRRPQENIPVDWVSRETAGVDTVRAAAAVREVVGQKGDVRVTSASATEFTVHYAGTEFNDGTKGDGRADLVDKMNAKMGGRWRATWDTEHDTVHFTARPELPDRVPHPGLLPGRAWHILPVAEGASFDLKMTSHLLIVGATNAGKTSLIRAVIVAVADSARRGETEAMLLDPKQIELLGFRGWPGILDVVTDTWEMWTTVCDLRDEMEERYRLLKEKSIPLNSHKRKIVIIDEYEDLVTAWHELWTEGTDPETNKPLKKTGQRVPPPVNAVKSLIRKARRCGIHLILGTQAGDASIFGGTGARQNLQGRAAVGPIVREQAKMAFGDSSIGIDLPANVKGRTTIQMLDREPEEVQSYWVPDPFDSDGDNTAEDWAILQNLGMPPELVRL